MKKLFTFFLATVFCMCLMWFEVMYNVLGSHTGLLNMCLLMIGNCLVAYGSAEWCLNKLGK